jgi:hypothetical protein
MKIKQIIDAWIISNNPTDKQLELAKLRGDICEQCPAKKTKLKITYCAECGCVISKKIFTDDYNPCPLSKWSEIDKPYFRKIKDIKTLL